MPDLHVLLKNKPRFSEKPAVISILALYSSIYFILRETSGILESIHLSKNQNKVNGVNGINKLSPFIQRSLVQKTRNQDIDFLDV